MPIALRPTYTCALHSRMVDSSVGEVGERRRFLISLAVSANSGSSSYFWQQPLFFQQPDNDDRAASPETPPLGSLGSMPLLAREGQGLPISKDLQVAAG